jgi:hypothetical protein
MWGRKALLPYIRTSRLLGIAIIYPQSIKKVYISLI